MGLLDEKIVLDYYLKRINNDEVDFLREKSRCKKDIIKFISNLKAENEMHEKIEISKGLWKCLFEAAMIYIDPDKRGYDDLFNYFDDYVDFEELIFASDSFYRDHTLHCLWVYFLGEYIRNNAEFQVLFENFEENSHEEKSIGKIYEEIQKVEAVLEESNSEIKRLKTELGSLRSAVDKCEPIRCISALTHDLGYPLKKIHKINKSISNILPYFSINNSEEYNFQYTEIQQSYIKELIKTMSFEIVMSIGPDFKNAGEESKALFKSIDGKLSHENNKSDIFNCLTTEEIVAFFSSFEIKSFLKRRIDAELGYYKDFENYNHGIMSAYLLSKTVKSFSNMGLEYIRTDNVTVSEINRKEFISKQAILTAIADHTNSDYQIREVEKFSDFLILIDEIEEFSRISRANKNRQYIDEFCKSDIYMESGVLCIDFIFDNDNLADLDPEFAFKGRCKRFLTLFRISDLAEKFKVRLRCIGKLKYDNNIYQLEIGRKFANISINGKEMEIPSYLKSDEFYSKDEYIAQ